MYKKAMVLSILFCTTISTSEPSTTVNRTASINYYQHQIDLSTKKRLEFLTKLRAAVGQNNTDDIIKYAYLASSHGLQILEYERALARIKLP